MMFLEVLKSVSTQISRDAGLATILYNFRKSPVFANVEEWAAAKKVLS